MPPLPGRPNASASSAIRLLDEDGREVPDGEPGELYSCTPYTFDGYWNLPDATKRAIQGDWFFTGETNPAGGAATRPARHASSALTHSTSGRPANSIRRTTPTPCRSFTSMWLTTAS